MNIEYKPILFNTDMVRAIMDGRKTQTRRVIKPQPIGPLSFIMAGSNHGKWKHMREDDAEAWGMAEKMPIGGIPEEEKKRLWTPPCHGDDILWVRETWAPFCINKNTCKNVLLSHDCYCYKAGPYVCVDDLGCKLHPSIHMPKEAARIFLRVTGVRVERLQDIDENGVCDEGAERIISACERMDYGVMPPEPCFNVNPCKDCIINHSYPELFGKMVWDKTIKPADLPRYGWDANPWVWVIEFEKIEKPEDWRK